MRSSGRFTRGWVPTIRKEDFHMHRLRSIASLFFLASLVVLPAAYAGEGPFAGVNLGVSEPTNGNYRAHVETGAMAAPYFGFMANDYIGLQLEFPFMFQMPDNDDRRFFQSNIDNENQTTTLFGMTGGPRLSLPLSEAADLYVTALGGGFKGLGGRLNQWAPGFSVGGGLDFYVMPNLAVGLFGRWNRAYMSPHPT